MRALSGRAVGVVAALVLAAAASAQCGVTAFGTATPTTAGAGARSIAVGDFNGDVRLDMAVAALGANAVNILLGSGEGTFTSGATLSTGLFSDPWQVVTGDLNNDGFLDFTDFDAFVVEFEAGC